MWYASGKINLQGATNPYFQFDVRKELATNTIQTVTVAVQLPDGTRIPVQDVELTDEYQTVKVSLNDTRFTSQRFIRIVLVLNFGDVEITMGEYIFVDNLIVDNETTTGIKDVNGAMDGHADSRYYDLQGRPVNGRPTAPGLYINQGRKQVIR